MVPRLLSEREVAESLRCSVDTIRRERKRGVIGFQFVGARIYYTEDQITAYLETKRVDPCQENNKTAKAKSGTIGSRNDRTAQSGAAPGSTKTPDRHAAHHLAQMTFGKRS